jgi:hypothetical protein
MPEVFFYWILIIIVLSSYTDALQLQNRSMTEHILVENMVKFMPEVFFCRIISIQALSSLALMYALHPSFTEGKHDTQNTLVC